ncbi:hypothetical protein L1987_18513 [Smallanthus sonchifolius]|uniref:Uncharacterized protein n=1 Tax=Smallanthus sonchifolius TaxID=185202 RepID=A0ACB9J0G1_9ASTR|nr:hypothetical protein L1987_18513 [Smallanthus sonchifolius]
MCGEDLLAAHEEKGVGLDPFGPKSHEGRQGCWTWPKNTQRLELKLYALSLRYQNFGDYYNDPTIIEDVGQTAVGICGNQSISEPTFSSQFVEEFLTDIRVATPKTSNFYVSSTRKSSSENATLYAIAQCMENTTQSVCQNCLNTAYNNLYGCFPNTEGRAIDLGCFMSSNKLAIVAAVIVGVVLILLILVMFLWYHLRKRSKEGTEDASELQGAVNYSYKDILKATDFGLARFQSENHSHVSTKFAGTMGYTAPEYATLGHLSEKVDTYSFGVVVLEIISGRRCNDVISQISDIYYLLEDTWKLYENNMHLKLVDKTLDLKESEEEHVKKIIEIGLTCTQSPVGLRPTMSEVVLMLSNERSLVRRIVGISLDKKNDAG